jgi:hypothetical protein
VNLVAGVFLAVLAALMGFAVVMVARDRRQGRPAVTADAEPPPGSAPARTPRRGFPWLLPVALLLVPVMAVVGATCARRSTTARTPASTSLPFMGGTPQCAPEAATTLRIEAQGLEYHSAHNSGPVACLAVAPRTAFSIVFDNRDPGIEHNIRILRGPRMYSFNSPDLFKGELIKGPATVTYRIGPFPPGMWTFHCDLHPDSMNGSFVVPVEVGDGGFFPRTAYLQQGFAMAWQVARSATERHGVTDASGVYGGQGGGLDSGLMRPGQAYYFRFFAAGTYPIRDAATGHTASVVIPVQVSPPDPQAGQKDYEVRWAFDTPPHEYVIDVQVRRPGSAAWTAFRTGTRANKASFSPSGPGTYAFRARFRRAGNGEASGWSPAATTTVR